MEKISGVVEEFCKLIDKTPSVYMAAYKAVGVEDKLTNDLLHEIELDGINCRIRSKTATMLRENRLDRRYYKDIVEELQPLYDYLDDSHNRKVLKGLDQVLGKIRKAESYHGNRSYRPRVNRMGGE